MSSAGIAEALRNYLVNKTEIQALVSSGKIAKDSTMPEGYIFTDVPYATVDKLNNSTIVVITSTETWEPPAKRSNFEYPKIHIDIWAAPVKDTVSKDVEDRNADDNIRLVYAAIKPYVHIINGNDSSYVWDGVRIATSEIIEGPEYSNVKNAEWHRMARISVGVVL